MYRQHEKTKVFYCLYKYIKDHLDRYQNNSLPMHTHQYINHNEWLLQVTFSLHFPMLRSRAKRSASLIVGTLDMHRSCPG